MEHKSFCIFSANFLPNLGGVERYTLNLARHLVRCGHEVTIVTSNVFSMPDREALEDGILIYRMPCFNALGGRFPIARLNRKFRMLDHELVTGHFDLVIVNTRFYTHSLYGVQLAKRCKARSIVIEHGTNHFTINNRVLDQLGQVYEHIITQLVYKRCRVFYGVSQDCCQWLAHFGISAKGVLYNAIDIEEINALRAQPTDDFGLSKLNDATVITYTGRLVREKGVLKLIDAVKGLLEEFPMLHLFIAGDGPLYSQLQKLCDKNIHVLGKVDFSHIVTLLDGTDIFCLPTDFPEGFPTSVLEASACGCYIITTCNGGSKELILDPSYGVILRENTVEMLMDTIRHAITAPGERTEAVSRTYVRLCEHFTWTNTVKKILDIEEELDK